MKFKSKKENKHIWNDKVNIKFIFGVYETEDETEIKILKENADVTYEMVIEALPVIVEDVKDEIEDKSTEEEIKEEIKEEKEVKVKEVKKEVKKNNIKKVKKWMKQ